MSRKEKAKIITKQFILDQLADNEVDLSMNELSIVPVKELAQVTRGTKLDLSRNHLRSLPDDFGNLRHLISLDLSSNKLESLPGSFGHMVLLQKLDLYSNQLINLPLSFSQLKKLKWLDLKNNPLEPGLREAAGTCVSSRECNQCATKVLAYMKQELSKSDRNKQTVLEKQRENDRLRKEQEILKRGLLKREKELRVRLREEQLLQQEEEREIEAELENAEKATVDIGAVGKRSLSYLNAGSVCTTLLLLFVLTVLLLLGGIMICNSFLDVSHCQVMRVGIIKYLAHILEFLGAKVD